MLSAEPVKLSGDEKVSADWSPVVAIVAVFPSVLVVSEIPVPGARAWKVLIELLKSCT